MQRNKQLCLGNVTGAGHSKRHQRLNYYNPTVASVPRNFPANRAIRAIHRDLRKQGRKGTEVSWPLWAMMSNPLFNLFHRAGLMVVAP